MQNNPYLTLQQNTMWKNSIKWTQGEVLFPFFLPYKSIGYISDKALGGVVSISRDSFVSPVVVVWPFTGGVVSISRGSFVTPVVVVWPFTCTITPKKYATNLISLLDFGNSWCGRWKHQRVYQTFTNGKSHEVEEREEGEEEEEEGERDVLEGKIRNGCCRE